MENPRLYSFVGGTTGVWSVVEMTTIVGEPLPLAERVDIIQGGTSDRPADARWILRGVTSNERYVNRAEKAQLVASQAAIGRPEAARVALIPIRKNAQWWALTQEERRAILEDRSKHIESGLKYLPAVARRLHHCRDLSETEAFDFLTLFDYAEADAAAFNDLVATLRATEEWNYVDREIDIRLMQRNN